jgi:hypothetical protein
MGFVAQLPAQAALTLTIDTFSQTFTWTGGATSDAFAVEPLKSKFIRLGMGTRIGGSGLSFEGGGSLGVSFAGETGALIDLNPHPNAGISVMSDGTFYTSIATILNVDSLPEAEAALVSLSVSGDGQVYSFAGLSQTSLDYLTSLDGKGLYFQDNQGGAGVFNIGSAAGQVVVIPEPSSALLLLVGSFVFTRWPRRARK